MSRPTAVFRRSPAAYAMGDPTTTVATFPAFVLAPRIAMLTISRSLPQAPILLAALLAGCSPQPGGKITEDVIEIEEIEMAVRPGEPAAEGGADARREVDAEKAAADKAIDEAARSIQLPSGPDAPATSESPAAGGSTQSESTADQ